MNQPKSGKTIDSIIDDFKIDERDAKGPEKTEPVTFWLPVEYKRRYDRLQELSKQKFGKVLKEVIKHSIDRVEQKGKGLKAS